MAQQWSGQQQQQQQQMSWSMCQSVYWGMPQYQWSVPSGTTTMGVTNQAYPAITNTTAAQPMSVSSSVSQQPAIQHSTAAVSTNTSMTAQLPPTMAPQQSWVMGMPLPTTWTLGMPLPAQMSIPPPVASIAQPVPSSSTTIMYPASGTIVSSNVAQPIQSSTSLTQPVVVSAHVTQPTTASPQQPWVIGMPLPGNWTYGMPLPPSMTLPPPPVAVAGNANVPFSAAGTAMSSQSIAASVSAVQPIQSVVQPVQSLVQQPSQNTNTVNSTQMAVAASTAAAPPTSWPSTVAPTTAGWQQPPPTNQWSQPSGMYGVYQGWNVPFNMNVTQSYSWQSSQPMTQTGMHNTSLPSSANNVNMVQQSTNMVQSWSMTQNTQNSANSQEPQPVGGMGMSLLQKMGWKPGEGLGKNKAGPKTPLEVCIKWDKRGLVTNQELQLAAEKYKKTQIYVNNRILKQNAPLIKKNKKKKKKKSTGDGDKDGVASTKPPIPTIEGKHPVSLLGEYCLKHKLSAPIYELTSEDGPPHQKLYLFKVTVSGKSYQASCGSQTKKLAKIEAAQLCLYSLGVAPKVYE